MTEADTEAPYSKSGNGTDLISVFETLDLPFQGSEAGEEWVSTRSTPEGVVISPRTVPENLVPNVVDMGLQDALYLLEGKGMKVQVQGRGTVRGQSVRAGTRVTEGMQITLNMSINEG
jgi:cell division protein FtsI (penicillin-binding protein 3)